MKLIYTTGWTRKDINTPDKYQEWLNSLKEGDSIVKQVFWSGQKNSAFDYPFSRWSFTLERLESIENDGKAISYCPGRDNPFKILDGKSYFWGYKKEWRQVFPGRVVPNHPDLELENIGDTVYGHAPVYEPNYLNCYRHTFLCPNGKTRERSRQQIREKYLYSYLEECENGVLVHAFSRKDEEDLRAVRFYAQYLYSQFIEG